MAFLNPSSTAMVVMMASSLTLVTGTNQHYNHPLLLNELPSTGEEWTTIRDGGGVEFLPASDLSPLAQEHLRRLTHKTDAMAQSTIFNDGAEIYYDEYSQGWRVLGFYIDCDADSDQGDCPRYLLWAAYVDEGYSGHEIGEYSYYDRHSGNWSDYACREMGNTERCVPMDCHLENSHFSLLGFFKEPEYHSWMEQLFKHEGDCVWTDDEYQFMQQERDAWPEGCTATDKTDSMGNTLYYDLKPGAHGTYDIGLYTDTSCVVEYTEGDVSVPDVLDGEKDDDGLNNDGTLFRETLQIWNDAFDVFKQCQPCKAYKLTAVVAGMGYEANADGKRYENGRRRKLQDDEDDEFFCHDAAGYSNVNQCMKFKTKTPMRTATFNDVVMASNQGTIIQVTVHSAGLGSVSLGLKENTVVASGWDYIFLAVSACLCAAAVMRFWFIYRETQGGNMNDPFLSCTPDGYGVAA